MYVLRTLEVIHKNFKLPKYRGLISLRLVTQSPLVMFLGDGVFSGINNRSARPHVPDSFLKLPCLVALIGWPPANSREYQLLLPLDQGTPVFGLAHLHSPK